MAEINILKWLYKFSPMNFYNVTNTGETIIKSFGNTFADYKFGKVFNDTELNKLRRIIKSYKRLLILLTLLAYIVFVYCIFFPHYKIINSYYSKLFILICALLIPFIILGLVSKLFENYIKDTYGSFEKTYFHAEIYTKNISYKDFKFEIIKIFMMFVTITCICLFINSPYKISLNLINKGEYENAIKMTTLWSKIIPIDSHWYSLRGYARFYTGDYDGAISDYDKAYELRSDEYKYMDFDNKIYIKYFKKDYDSALADFDNAIRNTHNEEKNSLLWDKAQFLFNIGKYDDALNIYNDLIALSVKDKIYLLENRLYYERAQVYNRLGKFKEADADLKTSKDLNLDIEFQNSIPEPAFLLEDI